MKKRSRYGWIFACVAALSLPSTASADSALDVSPTCTRAAQTGGKESLLSRGAFCQKSEPLEYVIVDDVNAEIGRVEIDAFAYSDNSLNRLEWPLKFRFRTRLISGAAAGLQVRPIIECGNDCTVAPSIGVPLAIGGLSSEVTVMLTPNMNGESQVRLRPTVEYKVAKTGDSFDDGASVIPFYGKGHIPVIRCDVGLAKSGTQGCVYPEAPAIMTSVKTSDPGVDESANHIKEAQARGMPGKFVPLDDGTIFGSSDSKPLERLRDADRRKQNRQLSKNQCIAQYGNVIGQCTFTGDPDEEPSACDCDEYPFAASRQGASFGDFSVKQIDRGDNRRAGARLGCFLASQRVLDGDEFYVDVDPRNPASSEEFCDAGYTSSVDK